MLFTLKAIYSYLFDLPWMNHYLNRPGLPNWLACGQIYGHSFFESMMLPYLVILGKKKKSFAIPNDLQQFSWVLPAKTLTWKYLSIGEVFISIVCIVFPLWFSSLMVWRSLQSFWEMQKIFITRKIHRCGFEFNTVPKRRGTVSLWAEKTTLHSGWEHIFRTALP